MEKSALIFVSLLFLVVIFVNNGAFAQANVGLKEKSYISYHRKIIDAEYAIFVKNDSLGGLNIFDETFLDYDFVFVDDCIEAFQLALVFKQDTLALRFLEKAMQNGFELRLLDLLNQGCLCNYFTKKNQKINLFEIFLAKHSDELKSYFDSENPKYVEKIKKQQQIFIELYENHIIEQLYKQNEQKIDFHYRRGAKTYKEVSEQNIQFIESLFEQRNFVGEQNLGIYTDNLMKNLGTPYFSIDELAKKVLKNYKFKGSRDDVPYNKESDYFGASPIFIMSFHNPNGYNRLLPFADEAIDKGFLHPREFAVLLKSNDKNKDEYEQLGMDFYEKIPTNLDAINKKRRAKYLPSFEVDYYKHKFQHERKVQLFFGFFKQSR